MNTILDWEQLIDALRNELQEKGGLIGLLNQQSNILYRSDAVENKSRGRDALPASGVARLLFGPAIIRARSTGDVLSTFIGRATPDRAALPPDVPNVL